MNNDCDTKVDTFIYSGNTYKKYCVKNVRNESTIALLKRKLLNMTESIFNVQFLDDLASYGLTCQGNC